VASDEVDPRYAARFQRGFDSDAVPPLVDPVGADPDDVDPVGAAAGDAARRSRPSVVLPLVAAALGALAVAGLVWLSLDPAFSSGAPTPPGYGIRAVVRAAPGPLLVAAVVGLAAWTRTEGLRRRGSLVVTLGSALTGLAALGAAAAEASRLAGLTAQGPVSSGGIPLPDEALATYQVRVQLVGVLLDLLPWLVLASALGLIAAIISCRETGSRSRV
jgi:hypothetical protein